MEHASHIIHVDAPREAVWDVLNDPSRIPQWLTGARKVEFISDSRRGPGTQWRQTEIYGPVVVVRVMELTEGERPRFAVMESVTRPRLELAIALDDAERDERVGTRLSVEVGYELPYGSFGKAAEPALGDFVGKTIARRSAERLKRMVEAREARKRDESRAAR